MERISYWYPIALTAIGVGIHLFGSLGLFQLEVHRIAHVAMLIVDALVVIGLLKKTRWGYWFAVILYIGQTAGVPYVCYQIVVNNSGIFELVVAGPLVTAALVVLLFNKKLFLRDLRLQAQYGLIMKRSVKPCASLK